MVGAHSDFFEEPWQRVFRSFYPILGVVYDGEAATATAREVRRQHDRMAVLDRSGASVHALSPDLFYWAHAVFFMTTIRFGDRFLGGVPESERRQLFEEHVRWYRLYGLTARVVPSSWEAFQEYWERMCRDVLEPNKATTDILDLSAIPKPSFLPWLPAFAWRPVRALGSRAFRWLTNGLYDPVVRVKLGLTWTARDER